MKSLGYGRLREIWWCRKEYFATVELAEVLDYPTNDGICASVLPRDYLSNSAELFAGEIASRGFASIVKEGLPLGTLYGYVYGGVDPTTGEKVE